MSLRLSLSLRFTTTVACLGLLTGCPDDGGEDGDGDSGTSTGAATDDTTGDPPTTGADSTSDGGEGTGSTSMEPGTDSGSTTASEESGSSSSGAAAEGICVGLDVVGNIGSVLGLDGATPGSCESEPAACGGDLVGTWDFDETCGQDEFPNPFADCDGSTFEIEVIDQTGSMTFGDDGSFSQMSMTSSTVTLSVTPDDCYGFNCAAFEAQLQGDNPNWTCEDDAPDCNCTLMQMETTDVMGTYETDGNVVTITVDGGSVDFDYCVDAERLDLWQPITDITITDTVCTDETDCEADLMDAHDIYVCIDPEGE